MAPPAAGPSLRELTAQPSRLTLRSTAPLWKLRFTAPPFAPPWRLEPSRVVLQLVMATPSRSSEELARAVDSTACRLDKLVWPPLGAATNKVNVSQGEVTAADGKEP
eukprot:5498289-Prymnesium_polylepis.1